MFDKNKRARAHAAPILFGLGLASLTVGAGSATSAEVPLQCEIAATFTGGAITLESTVYTEITVSGSYRFRVASATQSGSTNMQQGGNFAVSPGQPVRLGRIMLGDASAIYDATLEIATVGATVTCTKRVGGNI